MTDSAEPPAVEPAAPRYSVVVPFFEEADTIPGLVGEIERAMAPLGTWELVVVDDGSRDGTGAALAALPAANVRIVTHPRNRGQSAALCSGVDRARGAWIVTLDGDGQNDPADIPALVAAATRDDAVTLVCGHRHRRRDSALRRLSSRIANGVRGRLLGDATPDTGCGLKLVRREAWLALPRFDHMHRFLPALVRREGGRTVSVPVSHRPRRHGTSSYGVWNRLWVGIVDLAGVMWLNRRALPRTDNRNTLNDG